MLVGLLARSHFVGVHRVLDAQEKVRLSVIALTTAIKDPRSKVLMPRRHVCGLASSRVLCNL